MRGSPKTCARNSESSTASPHSKSSCSANPYDSHSVAFAQRGIEILAEADFPSEARKRKEAFVAQYGFDQQYWVVVGLDERDQYSSTMNTYLLEVAKLAHGDGQKRSKDRHCSPRRSTTNSSSERFPSTPLLARFCSFKAKR